MESQTERKIIAELWLMRHSDIVESYSGQTGARIVGPTTTTPDPDASNQFIHFSSQANQRSRERNLYQEDIPIGILNGKPITIYQHLDKLVSTPLVRGMMYAEIVHSQVSSITNNNKLPEDENAWEKQNRARLEEKKRQMGIQDFNDKLLRKIERNKHPKEIFDRIATIRTELRIEQATVKWGLIVDERLKNPYGHDIQNVGRESTSYSQDQEKHTLPKGVEFELFNAYEDLKTPGPQQQNLDRPMRAAAIMHGNVIVTLLELIKYEGKEETVARMTYKDQKRDLGMSIPHASGVQIYIYEQGDPEIHTIVVPTHEARHNKKGKLTEPEPFPDLTYEQVRDGWIG